MHPLVRLLGQKVAAVARNRPYRVRNRIFSFAPMPGGPRARKLVVLCEPRTFSDGCWSAWSWLRFAGEDLQLHLFVDGAIPVEQRARFERLFPGADLSSLPEFIAQKFRPSPAFARFLAGYMYARKLALLTILQGECDSLYSDADAVAFRRPDLILAAIGNPAGSGLFMEEPGCYCVDPWVVETAAKLGLPRYNDLNSGVLWMPKGSLDLELLERLLETWSPESSHRVSEQSILGVLMAVNGARALPAADYVVSNDGMFFWQRDHADYERIVARHFVGNVRHLLYHTALPRLLSMAGSANHRPVLEQTH